MGMNRVANSAYLTGWLSGALSVMVCWICARVIPDPMMSLLVSVASVVIVMAVTYWIHRVEVESAGIRP